MEVHPEVICWRAEECGRRCTPCADACALDLEKKQKFDEGMSATTWRIKAAERAGTATQEQLDTWAFLDAVAFSTVRGSRSN